MRPSAWILTDGKAGDEAQCLGLLERMGLAPQIRRVAPRPIFAWAMPWGPIDPAEAPGRPESPISPPFPDLLVATGRRSVPYIRAVKRASGGRTLAVLLKDPRTPRHGADLVWAPEHDGLRGEKVVTTLTGPHRLSPARLEAARLAPDPRVAQLARPWAAVLVGGDSRHHRFMDRDVEAFASRLRQLLESGVSLGITASRRTPPGLEAALRSLAGEPRRVFLWDGAGPNPYLSLMAGADAVVVTADSTNMVGEAVATGVPVLVFEPSGGHRKIRRLLDGLARHGAVRPFTGRLEACSYAPLDCTDEIASAVARALERHLAAIRAGRQGPS